MLQLTWLGTAGVLVETKTARFAIDPFLTRNRRARPPQTLTMDELLGENKRGISHIFVTHGHFDHSYDVPAIAQASGATVVLPATIRELFITRGIPRQRVIGISGGETLRFDTMTVDVVRSPHVTFDIPLLLKTLTRPELWAQFSSLLPFVLDYPIGGCFAYRFDLGTLKILDFGSLGPLSGIDYPTCDLAMVPVQGRSDITALAAEMVEKLQPRYVLPHHWDDFYPPISSEVDITPFVEAVRTRLPRCTLLCPQPGETVTVTLPVEAPDEG